MSMQITVDPSGLTQAQREAVAGFILAYPAGKSIGTLSVDVTADTSKLQAAIKQCTPIAPDDVPSTGMQEPAEAFGTLTPEAAFANVGAPQAPNAPNVNAPANALAPAQSINLALPPPISNGVELDANGLPWNAKIHAESKAKIADDTWRKKRNLDPAILAAVEAELRQLMSVPAAPLAQAAPAITAVAPQAAAFGVAASVMNATPPIVATTAVPAIAQNQTTAPIGEVSADARQQYVSLIGRASAALQAGKVTQVEITQCCALSGVPALPLLANRLDLVATIAAQIDALIAARS